MSNSLCCNGNDIPIKSDSIFVPGTCTLEQLRMLLTTVCLSELEPLDLWTSVPRMLFQCSSGPIGTGATLLGGSISNRTVVGIGCKAYGGGCAMGVASMGAMGGVASGPGSVTLDKACNNVLYELTDKYRLAVINCYQSHRVPSIKDINKFWPSKSSETDVSNEPERSGFSELGDPSDFSDIFPT